jgi:hypothetical protein
MGRKRKGDKRAGKKAPRRLFRKLRSTRNDTQIVLEYYQAAFLDILEEIHENNLLREGFSRERHSFWGVVPPGTYSTEKGQELVDSYLSSLEREFESRISRFSTAYWLHLYRRISPRPIGRDKDPTTIYLTRAVLDAAIQKWGATSFCSRIASSHTVSESAILRGRLVGEIGALVLRNMRRDPQLVLTDFGTQEYVEAIELEKLAYEVWRSMAMRRVLGKGARLVVGDHPEIVRDERSDELDELVISYDRRTSPSQVTATGTVFDEAPRSNVPGRVFLPRYNVTDVPFEQLRGLFEHFLHAELKVGAGGPNFIWVPYSLRLFYEAHIPLSRAFASGNGVSLESVVGTIGTIALTAFSRWISDPAFFFLRHWQRAYDGPQDLDEYTQMLVERMPWSLRQLRLSFAADQVDVRSAVGYLTLRDDARAEIGIGFSGPHSVFLPTEGGRVFIDYAHLIDRLYYLFHGVSIPDQNFKGDALEALTRGGCSALPAGELKGRDGTSRQIDAAFDLGDTLIIVECRASARSIAV